MLPLDEERVCESRLQHVLADAEGPRGLREASGSEAEEQSPGWRYLVLVDGIVFDILESQNPVMVLQEKQWLSVHCKKRRRDTKGYS